MKFISIFSFLIFFVVISSCDIFHIGFSFDYNRFISEKELWNQQNIPNYSFEYYSDDPIFIDVIVAVENKNYKSSTLIGNSSIYNKSIDDIYNDIKSYYLDEKNNIHTINQQYCTSLSISYSSNHIPIKIEYSYNNPDDRYSNIIETYIIKNFQYN